MYFKKFKILYILGRGVQSGLVCYTVKLYCGILSHYGELAFLV